MDQRIHVLLIEDDPDSALLMGLHLNEACGPSLKFTMECAENLPEGLKQLDQGDFDVVLLDLMLPESQGLETLALARASAHDIPIVVLTSLNDEEIGLNAVAQGAQDFLVKEKLDARLLKRAISYALERSRLFGLLESIIENSADGMVVVAEGMVRYANPAAEAFFGRKKERLQGQPFPYPVRPGTATELKIPQPGGGERIAEMRVTDIEWKRHRACLASIRDITELRKLEQIRAEIKERRRIEQFKDQILSTVSHELRSPLTVIKAAVANLQEGLAGPLSEPQSQLVTVAHRNVERLARIVNNLLDLSRLESGKITPRPRRLRTAGLIAEALEGAALSERAKAVDLDCRAEGCPDAWADQDMVLQVLSNLLDNALRFARKKICVEAKAVPKEHSRSKREILVTIEDDGPGIPQENIAALFSRFVQLNRPGGGGGYKGTGLGLAICQEIVGMNQGRIWAESPPGRGARLHFTLPLSPADAPAPEEATPYVPSAAQDRPDR